MDIGARTDKPAKIVIFASGPVGSEVVSFAIRHFIDRVVGIVVMDPGDEISRKVADNAPAVPVLVWRSPDRNEFVQRLATLEADIFLLAWWPYLLKEELKIANAAILNFHPSLLPHGRGKHPNFWALVEGHPYGVSIHHVVEQVDAGDIAFQAEIPYTWTDNGGSLYRRAMAEIIGLFKANYEKILNLDLPRKPQDLPAGRFRLGKELDTQSELDLDAPTTTRQVLNLLRARTFPPHPGCRFTENGETFEIRIDIRKVDEN